MPSNVYLHADGRWRLRFTVRLRDAEGRLLAEKQINRLAESATRNAAENEAAALRAEVERKLREDLRERRPHGVPTWGEAVELYRASCEERGTRLDREGYRLDILLEEWGRMMPLANMTKAEVLQWRGDFRRRRKGRDGALSPRATNAYLTLIVSVMNHAVDCGLLAAHDLHRRLKLEEPRADVRVLSRLQVDKLLIGASEWEAASKRNRVPIQGIAATHYYTAARTGNVLSLRWNQVDLKRKLITWPAAEVKNRRRIVAPIPPRLREILGKFVRPVNGNGELIWGRRWVDIRKAWSGAVEAANGHLKKDPIPSDLSIYCLRHSRATHLARVTTPKAVADLLGDDVRTVARRYFAHDLEAVQNAVRKLDG